nr:RHS repeat-associated core domain-containing protein [Salinispira pacifica]
MQAEVCWYDAENGRFVSEDPVRDGVNWYAYVGNDPVNFVDPLGLDAVAESDSGSGPQATMVPIVGAGATVVVGGGVEIAALWDTEGNIGVAITGQVGVGVEADIDLPDVAGLIAGVFSTAASDAMGVTTIDGVIQDFQGPVSTAEVHVILGASQDLKNPSDTDLSIDLAVGGGAYTGYTVVIELIDGDGK